MGEGKSECQEVSERMAVTERERERYKLMKWGEYELKNAFTYMKALCVAF